MIPLPEAFPPAWFEALPPILQQRAELRALRHACDRGDGEIARQTRATYLEVLAENAPRLHALEQILEAALAARLRVVPIKGACLIVSHYGDPGARAMADLDLLVGRGDLPRACALLEGLGFSEHAHPSFRGEDALHDRQFLRAGVHVELHYALWHEAEISADPSGLLARAARRPFGATEAFVPDAADHLYVVLVHAALHAFAGNACWITDALLLARGRPTIWHAVEALAATTGARIAVAAARDHLAQVAPGQVSRSPRAPAPVRQAVLRALAPWLQRGEGQLALWPSRVTKPLLVEGAIPWLRWAARKGRLWLGRGPDEAA